jgi:CBS domain-containing protein
MIVRDAMSTKLVTVRETDSVLSGLKLLVEKEISGAPVVSVERLLIGVVTEFDLLLAIDYVGEEMPISRVMTEKVVCIAPDAPLEQARTLMLTNNWRRLPVVEDSKVVGVVSRRDILRVRFGIDRSE